jgi:hypothetical protein
MATVTVWDVDSSPQKKSMEFFVTVLVIWLGVDLPLWKMMEFVNGKDHIPYIMENNPNVWNHQPVIITHY